MVKLGKFKLSSVMSRTNTMTFLTGSNACTHGDVFKPKVWLTKGKNNLEMPLLILIFYEDLTYMYTRNKPKSSLGKSSRWHNI